jgi:diphthamide biosynthesis enzyme Dph1/Dph2-like protein
MKKIFLEFRKKFPGELDLSILDNLDAKTISIAGTVQYLDFLPSIKHYLEDKGKKILLKKGAFYNGHVIGCNPSAFDIDAELLLLLADGKFHAKNNSIILDREIHVFNLDKLDKFSLQDLEKEKIKIKAKKLKFLVSKYVGIIKSTKVGQELNLTNSILKRIRAAGKKVYLFETDNISISELENFPSIQIWINTACYGLGLDDPKIINFQDILEFI